MVVVAAGGCLSRGFLPALQEAFPLIVSLHSTTVAVSYILHCAIASIGTRNSLGSAS